MEYYKRIREIRLKNNATQREFAELMGTTQQAYMRYEKGLHEMPIRRIIMLCEHYNLSANYVLGLTDEPRALQK